LEQGGALMERGPVALFGAIVAVGLGPALWLGAQFGRFDVAPPGQPVPVSRTHAATTQLMGGAGAGGADETGDESTTIGTKPRTHVMPLTASRSASPSPSQTDPSPSASTSADPSGPPPSDTPSATPSQPTDPSTGTGTASPVPPSPPADGGGSGGGGDPGGPSGGSTAGVAFQVSVLARI
jgi:hypothetical protein